MSVFWHFRNDASALTLSAMISDAPAQGAMAPASALVSPDASGLADGAGGDPLMPAPGPAIDTPPAMPAAAAPFDPDRFNLAAYCLAWNAERHPDKPALILMDQDGMRDSISFDRLYDQVRRVTAALVALDLAPGARVMIRMGNRIEFALVYFATAAAGLIAVPTSAQLTPAEAGFIARDCGAAVAFVADGLEIAEPYPGGMRLLGLDWLAAAIRGRHGADPLLGPAHDPALMIYTSGTSGRPKGVLHAHRAVWGRRPMGPGWHGMGPADRVLHAGQLNWTYTLGVGLMDPWAHGATAVLYAGPRDPSIWPVLIERSEATIFAAVPTVYRQMLKYGTLTRDRLRSLRHGLTAGEALPPALTHRWFDAADLPLYEALGMSEVSTYISSGPDTPLRLGSPGRPQPGRRITVLPLDGGTEPLAPGDIGVIAVHRDEAGLMLGYWNRPDDMAAAWRGDWFITGDLARVDSDGYYWYDGRSDEVMTVLGYRVSPIEVEAALSAHPAIAEVAVAPRKLDDALTIIAAYVVPKPGRSGELDLEGVNAWVGKHLARYKWPRDLILVDSLPRGVNGKIVRRALPGR